jgi:hypothetical protein
MALYFSTKNPVRLLDEFKKAVGDGQIKTWEIDDDGDITHTSTQWQTRAWLVPAIEDGRLAFYILSPKEQVVTKAVYAVYHARLLETMLRHFDHMFGEATASALAEDNDKV